MQSLRIVRLFVIVASALVFTHLCIAADENPSRPQPSLSPEDIARLKTQIAMQQEQIEKLKQVLIEQQLLLDRVAMTDNAPRLGEVAGPSAAREAVSHKAQPDPAPADPASPLQLRIGNAFISPVGFLDMTAVSRSTNPGTGIGSNFGSVPYDHTQAAALTETRFSIQNSRIGVRIDTGFRHTNVLGYWESDFLAQIGSPPNGGIAVTSNPYPLRVRLYWVDLTNGRFEFLAGQSWSLMTPNRRGISPLPGDLFYTQVIDVNYQAGLTWGRIPGFRFGYHFGNKAAFAIALENSEPYIGGAQGGSAISLPALAGPPNAISGAILGGQINNGSSTISSAAVHPEIIAKLAFDPSSKFHFEITGLETTSKIANPAGNPPFQAHTKVGGGAEVNLNFELAKGLRILTNNYVSSGGGRYLFGQAPDFIIRGNGDLSLVHSASTLTGFEFTSGNTSYYAYYGGIFIGKNTALDLNGSRIGYGPLASDGQNRTIQEITFGTNSTLARDPKWGALALMFQYSYLQRNPWLAAAGAPTNASLSMGFVNLRYTLPGAPNPTRK